MTYGKSPLLGWWTITKAKGHARAWPLTKLMNCVSQLKCRHAYRAVELFVEFVEIAQAVFNQRR